MSLSFFSSDASGATDDVYALDDSQLQNEIRDLASYVAAATYRLLMLVAEMDRRGAWADWGVQSCAHWLSWQCGLSPNTAREHVRVANALQHLPITVSQFRQGELTYTKVRAITRAATTETEKLLVAYAKEATAAQLERIVRGFRNTENDDLTPADRWAEWRNEADGFVTLVVRMSREEAAVMRKAHQKALDELRTKTPATGRQVDAFVAMAETTLAHGTKRVKDRYLVNLNVSAETLAHNADGECTVDGLDVSAETSRRLSCDAPVVASLIDAKGVVLKMGRKTRLYTGACRAAVMKRDKGTCIYPSCDNKKWIDVHHITHWAQGGLTDPENGAVLCDFHHRLVHEGGFTLNHSFTFRRPDGQEVPKVPAIRKPMDVDDLIASIRPDGMPVERQRRPVRSGHDHCQSL